MWNRNVWCYIRLSNSYLLSTVMAANKYTKARQTKVLEVAK